jgi:hypothetical protein
MPTTITQGFEKLRENLRITDLQESTVKTRQRNVRETIEEEMKVVDTFLTGSYERGTMITPLKTADVDVFVVLDKSYYQDNGQASLLDKVKRVLKRIYPNTPEISRNGQAVTVTFSDFKVDVVPGFLREGGGYLIADSIMGRWIATDPKRHITVWQLAHKAHNYSLSPLSKMVKAWNREHSRLLRSFHLEMMTMQILEGITISSFPLGVGYVLDQARTQVRYAVIDPAGYGGNVGAYLDSQTKINDVVSRLETANRRAVEAIQLDGEGKTQQAYEKWRLIFGDCFPAYG